MELKIEGKKINLRKLKKSDAQSIYKNVKDYDIAKYTKIIHPYKLKDAQDFIKTTHKNIRRKKAFELGIEIKKSKEIIGMMSLIYIDHENKNAEIGYWLGKKYWGNEIMEEAVKLILNFGFKELKLVRIYARVMHPNIASAKLLEKSGFQYEGRMRKTTLRKGKWMDDLRYSILSDEFKSK
ncbi:MAG: GNAT family N-acetyltransferase [Actinomycetia bacterium]|nr:GNAT family N-acetyltransferase [Actinomycetes bacterium]